MPTLNSYRGDAPAVAQVWKITPANVEAGDEFILTINGKSVSFVATDTLVATVVAGLVAAVDASELEEFAELEAADLSDYLTLTAVEEGQPFIVTASTVSGVDGGTITITEDVKGVAKIGEVQTIELVGAYTGGTWTYTNDFGSGDETTAAIAYDATAAAVQTAIEGLASVTAGDVTVTKVSATEYELDWDGGDKLGTELAEGSINGGSLTGNGGVEVLETTKGGNKSDAIFSIGMDFIPISASDDFRLKFDDGSSTQVTAALDARTVTAAQLQTALENLSNVGVGNVIVAGGRIASSSPVSYHESGFQFYVRFTGALGGTSFLVDALEFWTYPTGSLRNEGRAQNGGNTGINEWQIVDFGIPTAGTFTLTFNFGSGDETTSAIAYNASNATIKSAIQALTSVGASNAPTVYTTIGAGGVIAILWTAGTFAGTDVDDPTLNDASLTYTGSVTVSELVKGSAGNNEVHTITVFATGGTFTLTDGTDTTAAIAWNAAAATIKSEIESFTAITTVTVTGTGTVADPYVVTYTSPSGTDVANVTGDGTSLTGGGGRVTEKTAHDAGTNEVQELTVDPLATGGTYTLTIDLGSGDETTGAIAYNANAATIETALEGLTSAVAGDFSVTGTNPFLIEFQQNFAATDMALMTGDGTSLTGGHDSQTLTIEQVTRSRGPNHWNDPLNWTQGRVPEKGDAIALELCDVDILFGLVQLAEFDASDFANNNLTIADHDFVDQQKVDVRTTTTLPTGLTAGTDYYVIYVDKDTIQLSATRGGSAVAISDAGTGTHEVYVSVSSIDSYASYRGGIGLPRYNETGDYFEYRPRFLRMLVDDAGEVNIGEGVGPGSFRLRLDLDDSQVEGKLYLTAGSREQNTPAMLVKNLNAATNWLMLAGEFGVAFERGETAQFNKLTIRGGDVTLGKGHTNGNIEKTGGTLRGLGASFAGTLSGSF